MREAEQSFHGGRLLRLFVEKQRQEKTDAILELLHTMEAQLGRMGPAQADAEASMQDDEAK